MPSPSDVLPFWFGSPSLTASVDPALRQRWFQPDPAFDAEVRVRFGALLDAPDAVVASAHDAASALAAVVTLDQLPRNVFRGSARAFATDSLALGVTRRARAAGWDRGMGFFQRMFLYLPYQHAEDRGCQEEALALYDQLAVDAPPDLAEMARGVAGFARKHHAIVARFGRYPGRNLALGRADTPDEAAWIAGGGDTFGQR